MKFTLRKVLLILIIFIAFFFRIYNVSYVPPQPTLDEVSIGYNAYSILKTGADEYGAKFPVLLRAYDDWRPALYVYLVIPFVALLGLDVVSVRLPSVILSVFTVIAVYFLTKYLTKGSESIKIKNVSLDIPIITTLLFAISPWDIYLSRLGHEVNASFSFLIFGILFFFLFIENKKWGLILSSIFFALSFASYQSGKIIAPLLLIGLFALYFKKMLKAKSYVLVSVFIGILLIAPTIISTFDDNALIRFKGTSLIGNSPAYFEKVSERYSWDKENNNIIGYIYDNRKTASVLLISNAYLSHFNPTWLFFNESEDAFKAPNIGLLYLFELPLILFALILILRSKISSKSLTFIFLWAAVAVIPASITTGYPHAMRAYGVLPVPQILAAVGVISILLVLKNKKWQYAFVSIFGIVVLVSAVWFFNSYFNLLPKEISNHFQYGVINALKEAKSIEGNYDRVVVSNKDNLFESYMFYLYLNKLDPKAYQEAGGTISGGFEEEHEIGKYVFGSVKDKLGENTLYVLNPHEFQDLEINKISTINNLKGEPVLIIAESK